MPLLRLFKRFRTETRGVALVEFALILPMMLTLLIGVIEVSNLTRLDRKVTNAAHTATDLVSQNSSLSEAELTDIYKAVELSLFPFDQNMIRVAIVSYVYDPDDGSSSVDWSENSNGGSIGNAAMLVDDLGVPGQSLVVATVQYNYSPLFGDFLFDGFTIEESAFSRPRNGAKVTKE